MKIKSKTSVESDKKDYYPYIGHFKHHENEFAVLFSAPRTGIVIHETSGEYEIGHVSDVWMEDEFCVFHGTIELTV